MKALTAVLAAALAIGTARAQTVDPAKLGPLHDAGKAFERGLADPSASIEQVIDLRQKLEREAAGFAGRPATAEEKKIADLYASAAREYAETRGRFDRDKKREPFFTDLRRIQAELKEADDLFSGTVKLAPNPPPAPPPAVIPPPPPAPKKVVPPMPAPPPPVAAPPKLAPVPAPPPPPVPQAPVTAAPTPVETPPPPTPIPPKPVMPPPAPAPEPIVTPSPPPAPAAPQSFMTPTPPTPPAPKEATPLPPPAVELPSPPAPVSQPTAPPETPEVSEHPVTAPAPTLEPRVAPPPAPALQPPLPAIAPDSLNDFRKAANRVKIDKDAKAVSGCRKVSDLTVSNSGSGVYEVAGHNFYYGNVEELIRLRTAEAGGDRFVVKSKTKTEITGEAYRCGKQR